MTEAESRPLHVHTLETLITDLVSGRPVEIGPGRHFALPDERTRSALEWYRRKGTARWASNVTAQLGEELVDAIGLTPPELPALPAPPANASDRRLRLKKLEAHRFAGIQKFGTPDAAPENYVHHFTSPLTLLEGRNGSGKTSLLNAIIWALTGEMLRAQREPEAPQEFECRVAAADADDVETAHKLSSLTPMPSVDRYRPDQPWVPADTWVELTIVDESGAELPVIRRTHSRSPQGKIKETPPDLSALGLDPIGVRVGTTMPALLPLIKVGAVSELGRAVAQLTGLSALVDLAEHARRARTKIEKEFVKAKTSERDKADTDYRAAKDDLQEILRAHPYLRPTKALPELSDGPAAERALDDMATHFENGKRIAYDSARVILGRAFDPKDAALVTDLEKNVARALERASEPQSITSVTRLNRLRKLTREELHAVDRRLHEILSEATQLVSLIQDPSRAARIRLYACVATWISEHPDPDRDDDLCPVCGGELDDAIDPVTGRSVKAHVLEAASDAVLLSQTLSRWAENVQGDLMRTLPDALRSEATADLPAHPCDLLRLALIDELFAFAPFSGVLGGLKSRTASTFDQVAEARTALGDPADVVLPKGCEKLGQMLKRLDRAIRFARWRCSNETLAHDILFRVLGRAPKPGEPRDTATLIGTLLELEAAVKAAEPISRALVQCERLKQHLKSHGGAQFRLRDYGAASAALGNLAELEKLAGEQVDHLRKILRKDAAGWRSKIYLGAFPDTAHELVDAGTGRKGELDLAVQSGGVSAPAQHVSNASALRASLVAFFFAFWQYVLSQRGGLTTLLLDDPQELLDDENRERLAEAIGSLTAGGAQSIVTTYDPRFCLCASRLNVAGGVEHLEVHPATRQQGVVRTTPPLPAIKQRKARFEADRNAEEPARDLADACRVFLEAKLGDIFEDPAHAAWAIANPNPTVATFVQRLRPLVRAGPSGMIGAPVFRHFVDHPALADGSPALDLMNKAHHGRRGEIRAADVATCATDLNKLLELAEQMYEECYRWRRRDTPSRKAGLVVFPALAPMRPPSLNVVICPDLAAFTQNASPGATQEPFEHLDPKVFDDTVAFYLRRPNFGFAAPSGSIAIAEAAPGPAIDRSLAIVRHRAGIYARRLVRGSGSDLMGLTAEVPDPRTKTPKTIFVKDDEVAIHPVIGIIFDHSITVSQGQDEAVLVDASEVLKRIRLAFRVADESAVPLALDKQVVLGAQPIPTDELHLHREALVALRLDDQSAIFKRVGASFRDDLSHLQQFESIGGIGDSRVLAVSKPQKGLRRVVDARAIMGVLYRA